ncbi:MAG: hypothetical protein JWP29_5222 [Rhodoferax sp.]|nr:hypothetical protein [Rhodoferax sp.]
MNSDRIAHIAQRVRHVGDEPDGCASFQLASEPEKWVQYGDGKINAAYPLSKHPAALVATLGGRLEAWESGCFVTVADVPNDAVLIARWVDTYLRWVLQSGADAPVTLRLSRFKGAAALA